MSTHGIFPSCCACFAVQSCCDQAERSRKVAVIVVTHDDAACVHAGCDWLAPQRLDVGYAKRDPWLVRL